MYKVKWVFTGISHDVPTKEAAELYVNDKVHGKATFNWERSGECQVVFGGCNIASVFKCIEKG